MLVAARGAFAARKGQHSAARIGDDGLLLGRGADEDVSVVVAERGVAVQGNGVFVEVGRGSS